MASIAAAPSMGLIARQLARPLARVEGWLEAERDQLPLWLPVAMGAGIAAWFLLPDPRWWTAAALTFAAVALAGLAGGRGGRGSRALAIGGVAALAGLLLVWWRAERVARPVLARPAVVALTGRVLRVEPLAARGLVRVEVAPDGDGLPAKVRINLAEADAPAGLARGVHLRLRARLMPPPAPAVPGAYDSARVAWFDGLGATGRGFAPVVLVGGGHDDAGLRARLSAHIATRLEGSAGGIAAALATGDDGDIAEPDAEAMRRAGLAHLLSVSGLHITAVVVATMTLALRLLALSPWLALRTRLPLAAAAMGALAAIGYTLLTGAEVPTIRSCIAALLVLAALALGREAVTLRLVAAGALVVMLAWPEAIAGPSFQLSFAAIVAITALHEHPGVQRWFAPRDEGRVRKAVRDLGSLLLTGLVVEAALMPIGAFHFHKAGVYGAAANIVAIPLTTFVIMPLEAAALLADAAGLGGPLWWLVARAMAVLLWLAHRVASAPGSVAAIPVMPVAAFALMLAGGLWVALWRTGVRWWGTVPFALGAGWALASPAPDLLVTGDGRHLGVRVGAEMALLRDRTGDYTRTMLSEQVGSGGEPLTLSDLPDARCSRDLCLVTLERDGRRWRVLATRSAYLVRAAELIAACRTADIVVSERRLPRGCRPRWLKLDRPALARSGGVSVTLGPVRVATVRWAGDQHPWVNPPTLSPPEGNRNGRPPRQ